jgi:hypothetical protein
VGHHRERWLRKAVQRKTAGLGGHPAAPPAGSPKEIPRLQTPSIVYRRGRTVSTPWLRMCCPRCPVTGRLSSGIDPVPTATDAECWAGATVRCHARRCVPTGADPSHRRALGRPDLDAVAPLPAGAIAWPHPRHPGHAVGAWGRHAQVGSAAGLVDGLAHQPMPSTTSGTELWTQPSRWTRGLRARHGFVPYGIVGGASVRQELGR